MEKSTQELLEEKRNRLLELKKQREALTKKKINSSTLSSTDVVSQNLNQTDTVDTNLQLNQNQSLNAVKSNEDATFFSTKNTSNISNINSIGSSKQLVVSEIIDLLDIPPTSDFDREFFSKSVEANLGIKDFETKASDTSEIQQLNDFQIDSKDQETTNQTSNLILSDTEIQSIETSQTFHTFLEKNVKYVERILNLKYDPLVDYTVTNIRKDKDLLNIEQKFFDDFSIKKSVTSLDWSTLKSELFLASYSSMTKKNMNGGVLIWSIFLPERPEFLLQAPYPITKAVFHPYKANIVIGASKSGHILLWDFSISTHPIQQSPIDPEYHTFPICGLKVVGTRHAPTVISICKDSVFSIWNVNHFKKPTKRFPLADKNDNPISPYCFTISRHESSRFYVGRESGTIYSTETYERKRDFQEFVGHHGPVLGLDCHYKFKDLLLSCGVDWTVRLWNTRTGKQIALFSEYTDPIYNVKWSPTHPGVFATVDGGGYFKVWNLDADKSSPIYSQIIDVSERKHHSEDNKRTLTDLCFSPDGSMVVVGSIHGHIHQLQLEESLWNIKSDKEFSNLTQWINKNT